ncbi:MAG: phosphotransferase [Marinobacter sp.]|nr:phosphotransferase [Marinobacter sp.]
MTDQDQQKIIQINIPALKERTGSMIRGVGNFTSMTLNVPRAFWPVAKLLGNLEPISREQLSTSLDKLFASLYEHPLNEQSRSLTRMLRKYKLIPNEDTTENLIRFVVGQVVTRSPIEVPETIVNEFWSFFHELLAAPELKGLIELNLDIVRLVLRAYEPLIVELVNRLKDIRRANQEGLADMARKTSVLRRDLVILRRQIKAIRYIKPFLQTDPKDFPAQAQIVAKMVREFGPLFIKMAQVAAANADFLPAEIARELEVFQEDVDPMTPDEVNDAFLDCFGKLPTEIYYQFDVTKPLKSGSIGSVYLTKKAVMDDEGVERLQPVVVKVARHNLEREFQMGNLAIELMLVSSQFWAPHSKLLPFLHAMSDQVKEFTRGFEQELNFEDEAAIQRRFAERARQTRVWHVPDIYLSTNRILEMEYVDDAVSIKKAIQSLYGRERRQFQRTLGENFLFTLLEHIFVYNELHGDLHPGNIMVSPDAELYLIDWGNAVNMHGKWSFVRDYLISVLIADTGRLADMLIEMSTHPDHNRGRRDEIVLRLQETLQRREVSPLTDDIMLTLWREGMPGLHRRLQTSMQLLSNTYQLGIVIQSDYLHLSRSFVAMAGAYMNIYDGLPRSIMIRDTLKSLLLFPVNLGRTRISRRLDRMRTDHLPFLT